METILEQQRRYHEEKERLIDAMVQEILHKKTTYRDAVNSDIRLKSLLDRYMLCTDRLIELYEDRDGQRKTEIAALTGPNEFQEFYYRLKQIKDFYRKHPNEISVPISVEFDELAKARDNPTEEMSNLVEFTDEEGYGKYLDLHECYDRYINLKGVDKIDYITYLSTFDQLYEIAKERKCGEYRKYLLCLIDYLSWFVQRIKPLFDLEVDLRVEVDTVVLKWESGTVTGWPKKTGSALSHMGAHLDLSVFSSWEELASLGLDRLKSALMALGLKCGGTLEERAQRLFSTKGKDALDSSMMSKNEPSKAGTHRERLRQRELACLEAQVYRLAELVAPQRAATKENVQRKQARTDNERDESEDEETEEEIIEEVDDDVPYNPKNLPLGWDGKPIPYWLYKLHGLNISYNCEICGNYIYKGPKAFQRHFAEWRHAHGMRCLGIPNTAHFANVTQIEDALALWEKLKVQTQSERWQPETEEEYEDSQGNVVNRKTYEDLKRQVLRSLHSYINLKGVDKIDYITYLSTFDQLYEIAKERKCGEYRKYLLCLIDYLSWFVQRIKPLFDLEVDLRVEVDTVVLKWESGTVTGWPKKTGSALSHMGAHLDLSVFSSWEELASLGLDRLKSALMALGLKCGGTLEERAQRLFSTKGKDALDSSMMSKNEPSKAGTHRERLRQRELACLEAQVYRLAELVAPQRAATKENVQRKQARTDNERDESEDEETEEEIIEEVDDDVPYNPKNLPLGWDGKPIPYWLYKLHGLNISYNCEICGNYIYKGPKAFQRHFAEWRHAHGMRCLGIPNTAHFANVTQIEDALALWEKLKVQTQSERWQPETEEEYEDSQGNVVNRKTYEDLKRQGLL